MTLKKTIVITVIVIQSLCQTSLQSRKSMKYNISKNTAPQMPPLGKGLECFKLLLSMCSKDMREPLVPMFSSTRYPTLVAVNFSTQTSLGRSCVVF